MYQSNQLSQLSQWQNYQPRILIVDDQPENIELLSMILAFQGYQVEKCHCGSSAIELARSSPPDLITLDIGMPGMDGFEVCEILKSDRITQEIPIIFISALNISSNKTQAFKIGANDYVTKPFQVEEVIARVELQLKIHYLQVELKAKKAGRDRTVFKQML